MHSDGSRNACLTLAQTDERQALLGNLSAQRGGFAPIQMNGQEVYKFAVREVPAVLAEVLEACGTEADQLDWLLLHQANQRILDAVAERFKVPPERVLSNLASLRQHLRRHDSADARRSGARRSRPARSPDGQQWLRRRPQLGRRPCCAGAVPLSQVTRVTTLRLACRRQPWFGFSEQHRRNLLPIARAATAWVLPGCFLARDPRRWAWPKGVMDLPGPASASVRPRSCWAATCWRSAQGRRLRERRPWRTQRPQRHPQHPAGPVRDREPAGGRAPPPGAQRPAGGGPQPWRARGPLRRRGVRCRIRAWP